jgi:hypothetical protein
VLYEHVVGQESLEPIDQPHWRIFIWRNIRRSAESRRNLAAKVSGAIYFLYCWMVRREQASLLEIAEKEVCTVTMEIAYFPGSFLAQCLPYGVPGTPLVCSVHDEDKSRKSCQVG